MHAAVESSPPSNNPAIRGILLGGFFAGLADFIYPTVKTVMNGGSWMRPWKGVASGLLGKSAHEGGLEMVVLGASLHWVICLSATSISSSAASSSCPGNGCCWDVFTASRCC